MFKFSDERFKFLAGGLFNTVISYLLSIYIFYTFSDLFSTIFLLIFIYAISICIAFSVYNFFVFKSVGNVFSNFIKFILFYAFISIFSILTLWFLVDFLFVEYWAAQFVVLVFTVLLSFSGNKKFVFK